MIVFVINARGRDRVSIMTFWTCMRKIELSSDGRRLPYSVRRMRLREPIFKTACVEIA